MFKQKNFSPKQLAVFTALLLSSLIALSTFILLRDLQVVIAYFFLCFTVIYFLVYQILERFIYRKIKLLYKLIAQTKVSKREEAYLKYILPQKSIDDVREDVEKWVEQKTEEINLLQSNEEFRKEFLQNLSHEIKTPIFSIQGYLEILADGAIEDTTAANKFIAKSQANVQRLVQLLNDLDMITNLEINKEPILKQNFVIQDLITDVINNLTIKLDKKNIHFNILVSKNQFCYFHLLIIAPQRYIFWIINVTQSIVKFSA
jgi:two-component system phosphate regulon sensor histidine kinase PhoR